MRLVLTHDTRRVPVDVKTAETVEDLKIVAIDVFTIAPFLLSENHEGLDLGKLKLTHAGAGLQVPVDFIRFTTCTYIFILTLIIAIEFCCHSRINGFCKILA